MGSREMGQKAHVPVSFRLGTIAKGRVRSSLSSYLLVLSYGQSCSFLHGWDLSVVGGLGDVVRASFAFWWL